MTATRPIEHVVFPTFLQNHSVMRRGFDLANPRTFDRFLRYNALFTRGLVVVDSDLNNNAVLQNAAQRKEGLFWAALKTSFIRRAARMYRGGPLTQKGVAENLRTSSQARFNLIPQGYPAELDTVISRTENEIPPLIWAPENVNKFFSGKLLALLNSARSEQSADAAQRDLIDTISAWAGDQRRTGTMFGAADIESQLRPSLTGAGELAWEAVWPIVLEAHVGNIPLVFEGNLTVIGLPEANDRMLPAGPESSAEETALAAALYAGAGARRTVDLEVRQINNRLPVFNVNMERLEALSLEQIEDLREAAMPEAFFEQRFRATGSGEKMAATEDTLREAAISFMDRLATAGVAFTTEAQKEKLRSDFYGPPGDLGTETKVVAIFRSLEGALVEYAMLHSFPFHGLGPQLLGCDYSWLISQLDQQRAQALYGSGINFFWVYKRPDFRVIELLGTADPSHPDQAR